MKQKSVPVKKSTPTKPTTPSLSSRKLLLLVGGIVLITFFTFSPAMKNGFINWDDNYYVFENATLPKPLPEAITYFFGPHYFVGNYVPLTMIVYALEYHAVALDPQLYHTVNILIHLLNVILVFWFIYLLSGRKPMVAALVALFFGIHPMHLESVVWVSELKDVLYSSFFIAGLIAYYKYIERKRANPENKSFLSRLPVLVFILFVLSSLSKPAAVIFPLVILLLDFYTGRKFDKWLWIEKLPFFIVSIVFGIIAIISQQADRLMHDYYPLSQRFFFAAHSLLVYLEKLLLPVNLSIFYPYPQLEDGHLPYFYYITPVIVLLLFYGVYRTLKYTRLVAFGFLFFFVNIVLVLQLLSVGDAITADRYTYIPYIGLFFIMAMGFDWLYHARKEQLKKYKPAAVAVIVALALSCSYLTYAHCAVWENEDALATDLLDKFPDDRLALNNEGYLLFAQHRYAESVPLFTKAILVKPDYIMAYINLANSYIGLNDNDSALATINTALTYAPQDYNLLTSKGYLLFTKHHYTEAITSYKEALRIKKDHIDGYIHLAECYYTMQNYDDWINTLSTGLTYAPDNYILLNNKGYALFVKGKYNEALDYYKAALKIKPDYATALVNRADCTRAMDSAKEH